MEEKKNVIVAGGGPVGCAIACILSKKGFSVDLYESREDIRKSENPSGRSINLALSVRGISTLEHIGISEQIKKLGVPMYARMIHMPNKTTYPIPYGKKHQFLLSTDRIELNRSLLTAAEKFKNVKIHFGHKLSKCDPKTAEATFIRRKDQVTVTNNGAALFGCDGAYSAVRKDMMRGRFDYTQMYIPHGYMELSIPATEDNDYAMPPNYLHIWPRHKFMLIALPNSDKSFTCTLFMPFENFENLTTPDHVKEFFNETFPDALDLIGRERLCKDFFMLPPLPLVTVKCSPHNCESKTLLLGDAAHAVVPFYGQGLNAGLEDTLVFSEVMDLVGNDLGLAIPKYSESHSKDGHAIAELSQQNYIEMRSDVASSWFLFRKKVDNLLNTLFPSYFIPKYSMVTFTRIRYSEAIKRAEKQKKAIDVGLFVLGVLLTCFVVVGVWKIICISDTKFEQIHKRSFL